ncbi:LacI family DNA-binding transcriptional regulator [Bradyrhizobium sp.]|jgi:LacI family transcriptional regulator|uniref:LacI family DNA-binding transcriptional regulator n=1 Tax=Bradyrhizobium sp. TaxID=376 RepID=UPI002C5F7514|nr:LacI family DNA-binding transcriptional regulator [Bradyrhizobium sp.]HWX63057.1 LacI family DNA-binding transcriptional regulator [Bradyrhizobium sp.]
MTRQQRAAPASLATVAAAAGVSIATVSRIVNGETRRASAETVARVRKAIAAVGYQPNHAGRTLRRRESRLVAMLAPNLDNPVMAAIAASSEAALRAAGYVMILCDTHDSPDLQDEYLNAMRAQVVRGYIMVASVASPVLKDFVAHDAPMVFVNRRPPFGRGAFVGIDNLKAGRDAADLLWSAGLRRCGVLSPAQGSSVTRDRIKGFCSRLRALGATEILQAEAPGLSHLEVGYEAARRLATRDGWPDGLMCASDQIAYGAYRFAREDGLQIPERCMFVGIDGNRLNRWIAPWLRSIHVTYEDFGQPIVELLDRVWRRGGDAERIMPHRVA